MDWEFHYRQEPNYLEIIISGPLSHDELNAMAIERWVLLRRFSCRKILFDFTQITSILNTVDIYSRPDQSEQIGVLRTNHSAAVAPQIYLKEFKFMENVYKNKGFDLNVFDNKEDAIDYLINAKETIFDQRDLEQ
jgi:hypothetical protein